MRLTVSVAAIVAVAVNSEGKREVVGLHVGSSEAEAFWSTFLKSLVRRGLRGLKLVVSDAHEGLKAATRRMMGAPWQRCLVELLKKPFQTVLGSGSGSADAASRSRVVAAAVRNAWMRMLGNPRRMPWPARARFSPRRGTPSERQRWRR